MSTTESENSSRFQQAFTLLELLLVIVLMGIMVGVVFPRLRSSVRASSLVRGTETLADAVRFARTEAMRRRVKVQLEVNSNRQSYTLNVQQTGESSGAAYGAFGRSSLDVDHVLPQDVSIIRIQQSEQSLQQLVLTFSPDGIMSPHTIELANNVGRNAWIDIGPWVDEVNVRYTTQPRNLNGT